MKSERDLIHVTHKFGDGSMMGQKNTTKLTRREAAESYGGNWVTGVRKAA